MRITLELCSGSHATAPKYSAHKYFFSFKLAQCFFHDFFKYVVFQDQPEDYVDQDKIIDMIEVIVL